MRSDNAKSIKVRIVEAVRKNRSFLLLTHVNPDGDSVGSAAALRRVLTALGKECEVLFPGEAPPEYRFLLAREEMLRELPAGQSWQVVFLLDIPSASRLPSSLSGKTPPGKEVINIDHHAGNDIRGSLNWIDPGASSVGEMLFLLFEEAGFAISSDVATALYTAIATDTGSFRFPNTTSSSLRAAARLLDCGADAAEVVDNVYTAHSLQKCRLLGEALATLQTCCSGRAAYMWVTREMLARADASPVDTDGFVNFPRHIKGVEVAILFREESDGERVKVSLRSKGGLVEVGRVAATFEGGGHAAAAGCVVSGSIKHVQDRVLEAVAGELARADAVAAGSADSGTFTKG